MDRPYGEYFVQRMDDPQRLLGQTQVVTIWENNRSRQKPIFKTHDLLVDFHKSNWRYNSFVKADWNSSIHRYIFTSIYERLESFNQI